ncbi:MAG: GntR family transcriptional regulator [Lachnospiraceae bacterium]
MISKKFYDLREKLEQYIRENNLKAGDRLPSEAALSRQFDISRPTLREWLKVLQKEGVLITINGSGTYLCDTHCHLSNTINELTGTGQLIRLSGYKEDADIMEMDLTIPEEEWREILKLGSEEQVVVVKRIRKADRNAVAMAWNIFPEQYVDVQEIKDKGFEVSIFDYLEKHSGIHISHAESEIHAIDVTDIYDAAAKDILGEHIILMKQIHYDERQNPVFYSLDYFRTDIIKLKIRRERKEA